MLTYRLNGTTEAFPDDRDEPIKSDPTTYPVTTTPRDAPAPSRTMVRPRRRIADLRICGADDGNRTRVFSLGGRCGAFTSVHRRPQYGVTCDKLSRYVHRRPLQSRRLVTSS